MRDVRSRSCVLGPKTHIRSYSYTSRQRRPIDGSASRSHWRLRGGSSHARRRRPSHARAKLQPSHSTPKGRRSSRRSTGKAGRADAPHGPALGRGSRLSAGVCTCCDLAWTLRCFVLLHLSPSMTTGPARQPRQQPCPRPLGHLPARANLASGAWYLSVSCRPRRTATSPGLPSSSLALERSFSRLQVHQVEPEC